MDFINDFDYFSNEIYELKSESFDIKKALVLLHKLRLNEGMSNDKALHKLANDFSTYCYEKNNLDTRLLLFKIYFDMSDDNRDLVEIAKLIKIISSGLKYYKANDFNLFLQISYIKAKFYNNDKQLQKAIKMLDENKSKYSISSVFIGHLLLDKDDVVAFKNMKFAIENGNRSALLYECLYKYYLKNQCDNSDIKVLYAVIIWADRHKFDTRNIIEKQIKPLCTKASANEKMTKFLFNISLDDNLLKSVCENYIYKNEMSKEAFGFYKLAVKKQIFINNLYDVFIRSSYKNNYENISNYHMKMYLTESEIQPDIEAFIYHVMITNIQLIDLVDEHLDNISSFVKKLLLHSNNYEDKELTVLKYVMLNKEKFDFSNHEIEKIDNIVFANLFSYKLYIEEDEYKKIVIIDKNKLGRQNYTIVNNEAIIKSSTPEFSYYLFDDSKKVIEVKNINIKPLIISLDIDIYFYFYEKQFYSDELYIFLTNYLFEQNSSDDYIDIYNKTNEIENLSVELKDRINTYLARINIINNDYTKALDNIAYLSYSSLSSAFLEKIIEVYIAKEKFVEVKKIVLENYNKISKDTIIMLSNKISKPEELERFSNVFYKAFRDGCDDENLFKNVVIYSELRFDEQMKFYLKCKKIGFYHEKFILKILNNALEKSYMDKEIELIFIEYFDKNINNSLFMSFVELLLYKVIKDEYNINIETVNFFEMTSNKNISVYYILFIYYNNNGTDNIEAFNEVLSILEKNEMFFVTNEMMKNYYGEYTFFRKYKPFKYNASKDKSIFLHYRINGNTYKKIKMKYYKYNYFFAKVLLFFNEEIDYYFEEVSDSGSVVTKTEKYVNKINIISENTNERYDIINSALILQSKYLLNDCEKNIEFLFDTENIDFNKIK